MRELIGSDATHPPAWLRKLSALREAGPDSVLLDRFFDSTYDFPRVSIAPSIYVIAATPRSGSHYLGHLLFTTKQLGAPLEYLSVPNYRRWSQIVGSEDPTTVFGEILARRTSPTGWFGVIAHWFHLANFSRLKIPRDIFKFSRIIWIRRRDVIEQAVSLAIRLQTGAGTSFHQPLDEPIYNYQTLVECVDAIKQMDSAWAQFMTQTSAPHLQLFYEDIRQNEVATVALILDWFGLPRLDVSLSVPLKKQATATNAIWKDRFLCDMRRR